MADNQPPRHGHSHGGVPCSGQHAPSSSTGAAYKGAVLDDPSLLEDVPDDFNPEAAATAATPASDPSTTSNGWDDVLGSGSLLLKPLPSGKKKYAEGSGAEGAAASSQSLRPQKGQRVTVSYTLTRLRSAVTKLDFASDAFEPPVGEPDESVVGATGRIGEGDFITAIDMALQLMPGATGSRTAIRATARHCFNTAGKPGVFPPGADLYIELELLELGPLRVDPDEMDVAEKATDAAAFIDKGNAAVKLGGFADAVQLYNQALKYLKKPGPDAQPEEDASWRTPLEVRVYGNLAQVHLKTDDILEAAKCCDLVLERDSSNTKALYRLAKVRQQQGATPTALDLLKRALAVAPDNKTLRKELAKVKHLQQEHKAKSRKLASRMLGKNNSGKAASNGATSPNEETKEESSGSATGGADERPEFIEAAQFEGSREGYCFQKGASGVGYYLDTPPVPVAVDLTAHGHPKTENCLMSVAALAAFAAVVMYFVGPMIFSAAAGYSE